MPALHWKLQVRMSEDWHVGHDVEHHCGVVWTHGALMGIDHMRQTRRRQ